MRRWCLIINIYDCLWDLSLCLSVRETNVRELMLLGTAFSQWQEIPCFAGGIGLRCVLCHLPKVPYGRDNYWFLSSNLLTRAFCIGFLLLPVTSHSPVGASWGHCPHIVFASGVTQLQWIELWPPESYVYVPTLGTSEYDLFGKRVFVKVIKLKISRWDHPGLPRWARSPVTGPSEGKAEGDSRENKDVGA